jgi:hypothetical protein
MIFCIITLSWIYINIKNKNISKSLWNLTCHSQIGIYMLLKVCIRTNMKKELVEHFSVNKHSTRIIACMC